MKRTKIKFSELTNFSDKQKEANRAVRDYKYVLYGGAMGGGKSYWIRKMLVKLLFRWAKEGHENVEVGLFCEDYPALKDRHLSKIATEYPDWLGKFHSDHRSYGKSFVLAPEYGGGIIKFRNLDDPSKYASAEFACIAVDEITKNDVDTFEDLRTRLRWPGITETKFISATNPGGIGHAWVKDKWINHTHEEEEKEADQFRYIQALAKDNPHLAQSYIDSLSGLPADKRRAYLEGDWDIFKGQYFAEFRKEHHTCLPFPLEGDYRHFLCGDYGFSKPAAILWCAMDKEGFIYVYRELYVTQHTYDQLAREIVAMTALDEKIDYCVFDPAIWSKKDSPVSGADIMQSVFKELKFNVGLIKGINDRINGWNAMREYLKLIPYQGDVKPKLQVFKNCQNLINTLPSLVYDKHKVEDLDSDGEDHAADALRYGIMTKPTYREPVRRPRSQKKSLYNKII